MMCKVEDMGTDEWLKNSWREDKKWESYVNKFRDMQAIVIYGIEDYGKKFFHLLQFYNIDIIGFAVESMENTPDSIEGHIVKTVEEWENVCEDVFIVLTVDESSYLKVKNNLRKRGFKNILYLDRQEFWLLDSQVCNWNSKKEKICPICGNTVKIFLPAGVKMRYNVVCPHCGSRERHRAYWLYWERLGLFNGANMKLLHFAPERIFLNKITEMDFVEYYPVDISPKVYGIKEKVDITDIIYEDDMFDVIICNHVLEHIQNESRALKELRRVLKKGGIAFLNVPIFEQYEITLEKTEFNTPELRKKYYGQSDHVRAYGRDYADRLKKAGFEVEEILVNNGYSLEEQEKYGLVNDELVYKCKKI